MAASAALDLTPKLARFLDPHMVIAILENFVKDLKIYDEAKLLHMELDIARKAGIANFAAGILDGLKALGESVDPKVEEELAAAQAAAEPTSPQTAELISACGPLLDIVGIAEPTEEYLQMQQDGTWRADHLEAERGVTAAHIEGLGRFAREQFRRSEYLQAYQLLEAYEELKYPNAEDVPLDILWGKFCSAVMLPLPEKEEEMRQALADALRSATRVRDLSDIARLQQRTWLLHWSLFLLGHLPEKRDSLVDFYFAEENLQAVALTCPWLLRYLAVLAITHSRRRNILARTLTRLLTPEALALNDPMIRFLHSLLVEFDFEAAQRVLVDCRGAIATDFFLTNVVEGEDFVSAARAFLFDIYCRVHQKIDLKQLASQLGMDVEAAESWVVGLIRSAHLDAKVDSQAKTVHMLQPAPSVHWQIVDKTRDIAGRTRALMEAVDSAAGQRF